MAARPEVAAVKWGEPGGGVNTLTDEPDIRDSAEPLVGIERPSGARPKGIQVDETPTLPKPHPNQSHADGSAKRLGTSTCPEQMIGAHRITLLLPGSRETNSLTLTLTCMCVNNTSDITQCLGGPTHPRPHTRASPHTE